MMRIWRWTDPHDVGGHRSYHWIMIRTITLFVLLLVAPLTRSQTPIPPPPTVDARSYILVDAHTGKVLASNEPTVRAEPASLTKLMTAYIVFRELASGKLKLDDPVTISEHAWRTGGAGSGGSTTFLEVGKQVPVRVLVMGMIVQSGNDATIALAERIAGTEETFVQMMNATARQLGMLGTHFTDSSGLPSPQHYTTARDMALLANAIIRDFPQYYPWFSVHEFENHGITQQNRNGLLGRDGVDGMKTGHTESAGYCLVTSAIRNGVRLVSVVMGSHSMKGRESASSALLNYGFTFFDTRLIARGGTRLGSVALYKAEHSPVDIGLSHDLWVTVPRDEMAKLKSVVETTPALIAPLRRDSVVGRYKVLGANGQILLSAPLHPLQPVALGGLWRRAVDSVRLWLQ